MNRPAPLVPLLCALLLSGLLVTMSGCQRSTGAPEQTAQEQQADQTAQLLQALQKQGQSLEQLVEEVKRRESLEAQKAGEPAVVRDLAVARGALTEAQKAAQAKNTEASTQALQRLRRVLQSLAAELPGAVVAQHADRALCQILNQQAIGSKQFVDASLELLAASEAAVNGRPAEFVPDVIKDIDSARAAADKGDGAAAIQALGHVTAKATSHPVALALAKAQGAVRGAEDALGRQAWLAVTAELSEVDEQLAALSKRVSPAAATEGAAKPAATEPAGQPVTPPAEPAAPPAAGAASPPAAASPAGQPQAAPTQPAAPPAAAGGQSGAKPPPAQ